MDYRRNIPFSRSVLAAISGDMLEWFDFTVYGFLAPIFASQFFPGDNRSVALISAFAVMAVGYAARPVGSLICGHLGDKWGRKPVLILSVIVMGAGSVSIALLPTFGQIGLTAVVLLVAIRIIQGIAVAGEYTTSGVLLVEQAPQGRQVLTGSWVAFAMITGCALGAGVPMVVSWFLTQSQMEIWGWRIPFLLGGVVALISVLMRRSLMESLPSEGEEVRNPVLQTFVQHPLLALEMVGLMLPVAVIYFAVFVYAASFIGSEPLFSEAQALNITTLNLVVLAVLIPVNGHIADRIGIRPFLIGASVLLFLLVGPLWWLMLQSHLIDVYLGQLGFVLIYSPFIAVSVTLLTQMSPVHLRCSTVAIAYNFCMAAFGGTAPMVITYLIDKTGNFYIPAYYVLAASLIAFLIVWRIPVHIKRSVEAEKLRLGET
ncbi:MFS transporter [Flexibacterium corallicola]|uniref:MFS transporter n=1 Tax=Flexibacterium corallicola TaxID=3037259 RepID=UPI00286EDEF9|nr:MFS transporter [Pseudovibrio sp. M1P-2-3]